MNHETSNSSEEKKEQGEISNELEQMSKNLEKLNYSIENLSNKLSIVLSTQSPQNCENKKDDEMLNSDMGNVIKRYRNTIISYTDRIQDLIDRIQL